MGAKAPGVPPGVAHRDAARAVVLLRHLPEALGSGRGGAGVQGVGLVGHHVRAERARLEVPAIVGVLAHGAEHDAAAEWPGELRVVDVLTLAVHGGLLEPERLDEEADERPCVAGPQRGPDLGRWSGVSHGYQPAASSSAVAWMLRNSSARRRPARRPPRWRALQPTSRARPARRRCPER